MKLRHFYLTLLCVLLACSQANVPATVGDLPSTVTGTPTFEQVPSTLSVLQSEGQVTAYLENNGNCELPCVWGLSAGLTEYKEALELFNYLGWASSKEFGYLETGVDFQTIPFGVRFGVYSEEITIEKLKIVLSGDGFNQYASFFSVSSVIKMLGEPTDVRVNIGVDPDVNEPPETLFELFLYYKEDGVLIKYGGTAIKVSDGYRVCPGDLNRDSNVVNVESGYAAIYVTSWPQSADSPDEVVQPFWELPGYYKYLSFQDAFAKSLSDFSEEILENAGVCFSSPIGVWGQ